MSHHEDDMQLPMWKASEIHKHKGDLWAVIKYTEEPQVCGDLLIVKRSQVNQVHILAYISGMTLDKLLNLSKFQFLNYKIEPIFPIFKRCWRHCILVPNT